MSRPASPCFRTGLLTIMLGVLAGCATPGPQPQTSAPSSANAPEPKSAGADAAAKPTEAPPLSVAGLAWLEGCWHGNVNQRDLREVWLPYRGGMMLGVSETVTGDKTTDYEYLRLETRPDGAYYVASPPGNAPAAFKLTDEVVDDKDGARTFVFVDPARQFPSRIGYRHASEGWLYIEVEGKVGGADRKVIYPMRRVNCETGEFILK